MCASSSSGPDAELAREIMALIASKKGTSVLSHHKDTDATAQMVRKNRVSGTRLVPWIRDRDTLGLPCSHFVVLTSRILSISHMVFAGSWCPSTLRDGSLQRLVAITPSAPF